MAALYKAVSNNELLNIAAGTGSHNKQVAPFVFDQSECNIEESGTCLNGYSSGVLLNDGRALLVPHQASSIAIWNNGTVTYPLAATGYSRGVLLQDGNVLLIPDTAIGLGMYNPSSNSLSTIESYTQMSSAQALHDGRVVIIPETDSNIVVLNIGTITNVSVITNARSSTLVNDYVYTKNRVASNVISRFNYTTGVVDTVSLAGGGNIPSYGIVKADVYGNILFICDEANQPIYKYSEGQPNIVATDLVFPYRISNAFMLPNGQLLYKANNVELTKTIFGTVSTTGIRHMAEIVGSLGTACILADSRILLCPGNNSSLTHCYTLTIKDLDKFDNSKYISPVYNKGY